jgi:hypothetical protein
VNSIAGLGLSWLTVGRSKREVSRDHSGRLRGDETVPGQWEKEQGGAMEPVLRPFRDRLRRRLAFITDLFGKLQVREVRSQRMCPFCGLITPRNKTCCLECGKSLKPA